MIKMIAGQGIGIIGLGIRQRPDRTLTHYPFAVSAREKDSLSLYLALLYIYAMHRSNTTLKQTAQNSH